MTERTFSPKLRLGILAGGGSVPGEIAAAAARNGWPVHVVAIDGEADDPFEGLPVTRVNWGQIGGMLRAFRQNAVTHLVIVGRVSRPDLTRLKPDFGLVRAIPAILRIMASGGDDGVLRGVIRFFERQGLQVIGPLDVTSDITLAPGPLTQAEPSVDDLSDIALGLTVIRTLGAYDVGQSVVVRRGNVIAIEGAEGTDRMMARVSPHEADRSGILIKRPKPQQDMRVDVPVIGPETVSNAARAGLSGIAVLAGRVMLTQRDELRSRAEALELFVTGVDDGGLEPPRPALDAEPERDDAARGTAILQTLAPHLACRVVVVARKYVLAVEAGEGVDAVLSRVGSLRQWGSDRVKKRVGVAVLAKGERIGAAQVKQASESGLCGLVALGGVEAIDGDAMECAQDAGIFVRPVEREGDALE